MKWGEITMDLINNGLFPIAMCGGMIFIIYTMIKAYREDIRDLNKLHDSETRKFTEALNNNTIALQKLADRMEGKYNEH